MQRNMGSYWGCGSAAAGQGFSLLCKLKVVVPAAGCQVMAFNLTSEKSQVGEAGISKELQLSPAAGWNSKP